MRNRFHAHQRIPVQPAHQPREFAEPAFGPGPAGRQDFRLEHDLGIGDVRHVDRFAHRQRHRRAAQSARDVDLVHAHRRAVTGRHELVHVRADRNRDRQRLAGFERALGERAQVVGRDDVDAGQVLLLQQEAIDAGVEAVAVAHDGDARGDHRAAVEDGRHRHRQVEQIDFVADLRHLARRARFDVHRRNRVGDRARQLLLDVGVTFHAEADRDALARANQARHDRDVVAHDVMKQQRLVRLVDERRDVAAVDRVFDVLELARGAQAFQQSAKRFAFVHMALLK